jgi:streptogramin lyase
MAVEAGFGSAWVTVFEGRGAVRLLRVDAVTGEVTQITRLPIPAMAIGQTGLEVGAGSVWLATRRETSEGPVATVVRFDPATNEMSRLYSLEGAVATGVVVHDGVAWVPVEGEGGARLVGFDLGTDRTISVPLPEGHPRSAFASGGAIWIRQQRDQAEPTGYFFLTKVDPSTEEVVATVPIDDWLSVAVSDRAIWATKGRNEVRPSLIRVDPGTAAEVGEPILPEAYLGGVMEAGHGGIWFSSANPKTGEPFIGWLDPFTGEVEASVDLGRGRFPIVGMDVTPGAVWVIRNDGSLIQIDPT